MKKTITILFSLVLLVLPAFAQGGGTIMDGMKAVSDHYGVYFAFDSSLPLDTPFEGQSFKGKNLKQSLTVLFADTEIRWSVKGRYVMLQPVKPQGPVEIQIDTIKAASVTGKIDRNTNFTQTGLTKIDGAAFNRAYATLSSPDVLKTLQTLPGVASGTELLSSLYVHGGDGSDNLFLLDGVPLYQICHLGGIFSSFNTDVIDNMDFYKSGFPARYGGRTSSVVDIQTKDGDFNNYKGKFSIGLLEGRLQFEGPIIKEKTSFNVALRRSWADALLFPIFSIRNAKAGKYYSGDRTDESSMMALYSFTDFNAKVVHKFSPESKITANFYLGNDDFRWDVINTSSEDSFRTEETRKQGLNWGNTLASLNWQKSLSPDMDFRLLGYWAGNRSRIGFLLDYSGYDLSGEEKKKAFSAAQDLSNHGVLDDIGLSFDGNWRPKDGHKLRFGGSGIMHSFRPDYSFSDYDEYGEKRIYAFSQNDSVRVAGGEISLYAEDEMRITDWLRANAGLRNTMYFTSDGFWNSLEPRLAVKIQCLPGLDFKASYSVMSQFAHRLSATYLDLPTDCWLPSGGGFPPLRSGQLAAGLYAKLPYNLHVTVEGWYKTMDNLVDYKESNSIFPRLDESRRHFRLGKGRSYGMELDLGYETKSLQVNAYYTLSKSERFFGDYWPEWYPDRNDNRHKITVQANWRVNGKWELYCAWNYHSGNRMTLPTHFVQGAYIGTLSPEFCFTEPNCAQIPDYHRMDIGANLHGKTRRGHEYVWNFSIYNVYCRLNPLFVSMTVNGFDLNRFDYNPGYVEFQGMQSSMIPIIPSFSYSLKF